jgi:hypothetical protein
MQRQPASILELVSSGELCWMALATLTLRRKMQTSGNEIRRGITRLSVNNKSASVRRVE